MPEPDFLLADPVSVGLLRRCVLRLRASARSPVSFSPGIIFLYRSLSARMREFGARRLPLDLLRARWLVPFAGPGALSCRFDA
jgi:hypothetical protein